MPSDCLTFAQGQVATLTAQFTTSPAGMPVDVPDATVAVYLGAATPLPPTAMSHVTTGFYYHDWLIPNSLPVDTYTVRYSGTVLGVPTAASAYLKVLPAGTPTGVTQTQKQVELTAALEVYLGCAQRIPVYAEPARRNGARTAFQFTWPRWNLGNHAIFVNDMEITDGFSLDCDTGTCRFAAPQYDSDRVAGTYNFRFFSNNDMLRFLADAIAQYNIEPPGTNWTIDSFPDGLYGIVLQGAAANALQKMLMCLNFQEIQTIFGGKDRAQAAMSNLQSLKQNYEQRFMEFKKQAKRARYPSIAGIVQPEYTLPGGRSRWFRYLFSSSI
jgi:hypothetical protein